MRMICFPRVETAINSDAFAPAKAPPMHQTVTTPETTPAVRKKRPWTRKRKIIYGAIGLVVLWIVFSIIWSKREKPIPVTTENAVRKTILQTVSATGKVQPETEVKISPEVAGEIIELPVEDGKSVKKGDLLVKINPDSGLRDEGGITDYFYAEFPPRRGEEAAALVPAPQPARDIRDQLF